MLNFKYTTMGARPANHLNTRCYRSSLAHGVRVTVLGWTDPHGRDQNTALLCDAGITSESLAQPPVQLVVGDADEAFQEAAAALAPLANVTVVVAPPNAGDSAYVHSALCYAHALELCSQHARCASPCHRSVEAGRIACCWGGNSVTFFCIHVGLSS